MADYIKELKENLAETKRLHQSGEDQTPEGQEKFDGLYTRSLELESLIEADKNSVEKNERMARLDEIESNMRTVKRHINPAPTVITRSEKQDTGMILRSWGAGETIHNTANCFDFDNNKLTYRSLNVATPGDGGYTVGQSYNPILEKLSSYNFDLAQACTVFTTDDDSDYHNTIMDDTANSGEYIAEENEISDDQDPTFSEVIHKSWDWYSPISRVSNKLMKNSRFDLAAELYDAFNGRFDRFLENACVSTNAGSTAPEGLLKSITVGVNLATGNPITLAKLQALLASVPYEALSEPGCSWIMHYQTWQAICQMVDTTGRLLVNADVQNGTIKKLLGYTVYICNKMTSIASPGDNQPLISFGNHKDYKIRNVNGVDFTKLVEAYAKFGQTGFLMHRSYDARWIKKTLVRTLNSFDS